MSPALLDPEASVLAELVRHCLVTYNGIAVVRSGEYIKVSQTGFSAYVKKEIDKVFFLIIAVAPEI